MSANIYRGGIIGGLPTGGSGVWGVGDNGLTYVPFLAKASGGVITVAGGYVIHTFLITDMFMPLVSSLDVEYLVVAGGGAGGTAQPGGRQAAGGGGGGYRTSFVGAMSGGGASAESMLTVTGPLLIEIGAGGAMTPVRGNSGSPTVFGSVTSIGGGGGGGDGVPSLRPGLPGGSGGGAALDGAAGTGEPGQGFDGGPGAPAARSGGGGGAGGAGTPGGVSPATNPKPGGPGLTLDGITRAAGGAARGAPAGAGASGSANSGDGGEGGGNTFGGSGGSGIVIVRYAF